MMRLVTCFCILAILAYSVLAISTEPSKEAADREKDEVITVFLTGSELGALKPCGCSGGQLGGLDRRSAILNGVRPEKRLIVDTGLFVEGTSEQDLIKFNIIVQALSLLNYDLVNLTEKDIEIAENLGVLDTPIVGFISAHDEDGERISAKFSSQYLLKGKPVLVSVASFDTESAPIEKIGELFVPRCNLKTVNILILNRCDAGVIDSVTKTGVVDCLVCPSEADEPGIIGDPNEGPLVVSVGRYGKYVGKLEIKLCESIDKLKLSFSSMPVTEDLSQKESLVELYKIYQQIVKDANLLEIHPRFSLPDGIEYVGSKSCESCHEYEYEKWSGQAHADAYATLERVGSQFDPECVVCHVIGMDYESGFISEQESDYLKDVGCESCHGPGSEHIRTLGVAETVEPWLDCGDCHTPEHSTDYAGNEELYMGKIIHWREQRASSNVKK
ncbi:MAG: multiheme c-type cytochrome [Planctomycetota bacterium]